MSCLSVATCMYVNGIPVTDRQCVHFHAYRISVEHHCMWDEWKQSVQSVLELALPCLVVPISPSHHVVKTFLH